MHACTQASIPSLHAVDFSCTYKCLLVDCVYGLFIPPITTLSIYLRTAQNHTASCAVYTVCLIRALYTLWLNHGLIHAEEGKLGIVNPLSSSINDVVKQKLGRRNKNWALQNNANPPPPSPISRPILIVHRSVEI